jgi:hypothetical protein
LPLVVQSTHALSQFAKTRSSVAASHRRHHTGDGGLRGIRVPSDACIGAAPGIEAELVATALLGSRLAESRADGDAKSEP